MNGLKFLVGMDFCDDFGGLRPGRETRFLRYTETRYVYLNVLVCSRKSRLDMDALQTSQLLVQTDLAHPHSLRCESKHQHPY